MAEAGGLAGAPAPGRKKFSNPSLEILTPFRVILLIWLPLIFFFFLLHPCLFHFKKVFLEQNSL